MATETISTLGSSRTTLRSPGVVLPSTAGLRALDPKSLGVWVFLATVTMLFAAFSSAYLVRMASGGWRPIELPGMLWITTGVLVFASASLELARRRTGSVATAWVGVALGAGLVFLAGQVAAWRVLAAAGVFVASSPHAAFLYIFTALHGAHLAGGLLWLAILWPHGASSRAPLARCATYWHFMAGLWIYLFAVLHLR